MPKRGGPGKPIHNVPFEDLKALGSLTVPRGEFWNKHPQTDLLQIVKGISSAAHIYNQIYVEAEAFTSVWLWQEGPSELKPLADRAMCEGLNRFVYHTFPHTPPESGMPGWIYNFGTIINTTNGWWDMSEGFHNYLARCSYLLQQGNFVGDVAFYYGDRAPNFVGPKRIFSTLGTGYDYDVVNSDVILNKMTVKDGRIYLPHGQYYEVLVLPSEKYFNPEVLRKIEKMVSDGATIIGPKPTMSYSLTNATNNDQMVKEIAGRLWADVDSIKIKENTFGKGKVVWGKSVREVLLERSIVPDFLAVESSHAQNLDYIHRSVSGTEIYFVRNKTADNLNSICTFRIKDKTPEYWDPQTGNIIPVKVFSSDEATMEMPLSFGPYASCFIVFREPSGKKSRNKFPSGEIAHTQAGEAMVMANPLLTIDGPWDVRFQYQPGTPVSKIFNKAVSWHESEDPSIRYFSGKASYRTNFTITDEQLNNGNILLLELNKVVEIAEVYLNGNRLGLHWDPSHRFDITKVVKPGENHLIIDVVNSINNELVGDAQKPAEFRQTRSNINKLPNAWTTPFAEAKLIPAGLIGPVRIRSAQLID